MSQHPHPTDDQFEAAWRLVRKPDWPESLEDLKRAAARYGIVKLNAALIAEGKQPALEACADEQHRRKATTVHVEQVMPASAYQPTRRRTDLHVPLQQPLLDQKRRAAGERDDD